MKPRHLLAGLFSIAAVSFDAAVANRLRTAPDIALMLFLGAACGQLVLLSVWCVWGSAAWLVRLVSVLAAAALLSVPLAAATSGRRSEWFLVLCLLAALSGGLWIGARWWGLDARVVEEIAGADRRLPLRRGQFSLGGLLSLVTLVGILCGLGPQVAFPWPHALALAGYGMCLVCVAAGSVWAMVSCQHFSLRIAVLTLLCIAAGVVMHRTELTRTVWFFTMVAFGQAVVICLGLHVWSVGGSCRDWSRASRS